MFSHAQLRTVNAVVEEGGFSAAARKLGVSQSAVSQTIRKLEDRAQVELFQRMGRHLIPTDLCLQLATITDKLHTLEEEVNGLLSQHQHTALNGTLRIGLGNTMPGIKLIGQFKKHHSHIKVEVQLGNYATISQRVEEREVDVGILPNFPLGDGRFIGKTCLTQSVVAIVPETHYLAQRSSLSLQELSLLPLIFRSRGSFTQKMLEKGFANSNITLPKAELTLESREGVCEAVVNGLGIGFVLDQSTTRSNGMVQIPVDEMSKKYKEVVFRRSDTRTNLVDAFLNSV